MNLKKTVLSEGSQSQKTTYCIIPLICNVQHGEIYRDRQQVSGSWRLKVDGLEVMAKGYEVPFWGNQSILKLTVLVNVQFCD